MRLWRANAHQWGPGKLHAIDGDKPSKTMCGKSIDSVPGNATEGDDLTCNIRLKAIVTRREHAEASERWAQQSAVQVESIIQWDLNN